MSSPEVWPFKPSTEEMNESIDFLTDVGEFDDLTEQRRELRAAVQGSIEYVSTIFGARLIALFRAMLHHATDQIWTIPLWPYKRRLTVAASAGDVTIWTDTTNLPYRVGQHVVIWKSATECEACPITVIDGGGAKLTVASPGVVAAGGYAIGTECAPGEEGWISEQTDVVSEGRDVAEARVLVLMKSMDP